MLSSRGKLKPANEYNMWLRWARDYGASTFPKDFYEVRQEVIFQSPDRFIRLLAEVPSPIDTLNAVTREVLRGVNDSMPHRVNRFVNKLEELWL